MTASINNIDKKRIARNTIYLYIRTLLSLGVNFYTVWLLLKILGVDDYGIFNLVFGFVLMFMTLNNALTGMVHRFLCYEMGKANQHNVRLVFSISLLFFCIAAVFYVLLGETIGLWFVANKLAIPPASMTAALAAYQFAIITVVIKTIQVPYMSAITAFERMAFFAKITIVEVLGNLCSVLLLLVLNFDHLIAYSFFYTLTAGVIAGCYGIFCHRTFPECKLTKKFSKARMGVMGRYFSWSTMGALAHVFRTQGLNILINLFGNVGFNATWGLSSKLSSAVMSFVSSFQMALNPQIVKAYGAQNRTAFFDLTVSASRYSFLLLWIFALPLLLNVEFLLKLWLGDVLPPQLVWFVVFFILSNLIDAVCGPLWTAAQANERIGYYQVPISFLIILTFIVSLVVLLMGGAIEWVPVIVFLMNGVAWFYRILYLKYMYDLPLRLYFTHAILRIIGVLLLSGGTLFGLRRFFVGSLLGNWFFVTVCVLANMLFIFCIGLNCKEKLFCIQRIQGILKRDC